MKRVTDILILIAILSLSGVLNSIQVFAETVYKNDSNTIRVIEETDYDDKDYIVVNMLLNHPSNSEDVRVVYLEQLDRVDNIYNFGSWDGTRSC